MSWPCPGSGVSSCYCLLLKRRTTAAIDGGSPWQHALLYGHGESRDVTVKAGLGDASLTGADVAVLDAPFRDEDCRLRRRCLDELMPY